MKKQIESGNLLKKLHVKNKPLILFNIWDVASARCVAESGAKAIATSSWSVAATYGYNDGEKLPLNLVTAHAQRIVNAVKLPVTIDFEGGYADTLKNLEKNISMLIDTGISGINFEDQIIGKSGLYSIEQQCERIASLRKIAIKKSTPLFINARTDIFFQPCTKVCINELLEQTLIRASTYADSGADGFFVPGLNDIDAIIKLCDLSPIPINVMLPSKDTPIKLLEDAGVSRISYGPNPFFQAMNKLKKDANAVLNGGTITK